jgi:uncharacterized protein
MMTSMAPVVRQHLQEIASVCRKHRVKRLDLFGSAARDDSAAEPNDIDLFVEFEDYDSPAIADQWFGLQEDLQALLGYPIDLTSPRTAQNPYFLAVANRDRVSLYAA